MDWLDCRDARMGRLNRDLMLKGAVVAVATALLTNRLPSTRYSVWTYVSITSAQSSATLFIKCWTVHNHMQESVSYVGYKEEKASEILRKVNKIYRISPRWFLMPTWSSWYQSSKPSLARRVIRIHSNHMANRLLTPPARLEGVALLKGNNPRLELLLRMTKESRNI